MKDIDFDELDRAVNSLINNPTPASKAESVPVSQGLPSSAPATMQAPVATAPAPTPMTSPSVPRPNSGRFMDVVHPSSDMRATPTPPKPASRQGMTITPPTPAANTWPDPIDDNKDTSTPEATEESPKPKSQIADDIAKSLSQDEPASPDSPFLSNTKVEKRPLGAFSTESPAPASVAEAPSPAPEDSKPDNRSDHPIETDTPLPAELQDNLLSIEDDESPTAAVPTSITQQYTEQPSTGSQPSGAIFDAEAYHKPLSHPKKNKSGWFVVMWIFVLLVVGAGAGAAVYFYVLPLL